MSHIENGDPDYAYHPKDWNETYPWADRDEMLGDASDSGYFRPGEIVEVATLIQGPAKFAAAVPTVFDEDGDVEDCDTRWFDTREEAEQAIAVARTKRQLGLLK